MLALWILVALVVGFIFGGTVALRVAAGAAGTIDLEAVAAKAALQVAQRDGANLGRLAWGKAAELAARDGRAQLPARPWTELSPDHREAVYRVAAAAVVVLVEDARERLRRAKVAS